MNLWLDAQLSPRLASWINQQFPGVTATALRDLGLRDAEDTVIYQQACAASVVVMTKDRDFVDLQSRLGSPPKIIWLTRRQYIRDRSSSHPDATSSNGARLSEWDR